MQIYIYYMYLYVYVNIYTRVYFGPDCIPPHLLHTESICFHQDRLGKIQPFPAHSEFSC